MGVNYRFQTTVLILCLLVRTALGVSYNHKSTTDPCCQDLCKSGCQQSPINIAANCALETELPPLKFCNHWGPDVCLTMTLGGETVLLRPPKELKMTLEGGPLSGTYVLDQMHFHWGETDQNGTEHCIDNTKYAMEAHFVYYNCMYKCVAEALGKADGIAIVAVILEAKPTFHNCHLDPILNNLCKLKCPGSTVSIKKNVFRMFKEITETQEYFTYEGSLTTPPCCEHVVWIIFKCFANIHCSQIQPFRTLVNDCGKPICKNWRKIQALNGRTVYSAKATECST